jgi:hypothetical protein
MKVKDAIKYLSALPEDEEIIIAWWEWDSFSDICTEEEWSKAMDGIERWMDWSGDHETIQYLIEESKHDN